MHAMVDIAEMLDRLPYVVQGLGLGGLFHLMTTRVFKLDHYFLLGRNLTVPLECQQPLGNKILLAEVTRDDLAKIKDCLNSLDPEDKKEILSRLFFYRDGFRNCYVIKSGDEIAHIQWIIFPSENEVIREKYSTRFCPLTSSQVVIENAFTFPRYRGRGYLQYGTARLLDLASSKGYKSAICYIRKDRLASLNEFTKMGFRFIRIMKEYKIMGRVWRNL